MLQWSEAEESSVGEKQNLGNFFFILEKNRLQVFNFLRQDFPETLVVGFDGSSVSNPLRYLAVLYNAVSYQAVFYNTLPPLYRTKAVSNSEILYWVLSFYAVLRSGVCFINLIGS